MAGAIFKPALVVVDMQEDFCPPNGTLAVAQGRDVVPLINQLLALPAFALRVATMDWHPADHISFAVNHLGDKQPFVDLTMVINPLNPAERYETRLWPVHCVQDTPGSALVAQLDNPRIDCLIRKGTDPRVEMYSAFYTPLREPRIGDSGLAGVLREAGITDVFVVGLAADYCVRWTAMDAVAEGFRTFVVEEATRAVDPAGWPACREDLRAARVGVVSWDGPEVRRLRAEV